MTTYTIEIMPFNCSSSTVWYKTKSGRQYEAVLACRSHGKEVEIGTIAFKVASNLWVNPDHCIVISEIKKLN